MIKDGKYNQLMKPVLMEKRRLLAKQQLKVVLNK